MILVRSAVVRPVIQRGAAAVRHGVLAGARGAGVMLGQLGESGPAATAVSLLLAAGLGVLALRMISFSEETKPVLQGPPPAMAERAVRPTASRPADPPAWRNPSLQPRAILLAGTPEHAERLRAAISEANLVRDAERIEPLEYDVYLVASPEAEQAIRQMVDEYNLNSEALGAPLMLIIDMRKPTEVCEPDREASC